MRAASPIRRRRSSRDSAFPTVRRRNWHCKIERTLLRMAPTATSQPRPPPPPVAPAAVAVIKYYLMRGAGAAAAGAMRYARYATQANGRCMRCRSKTAQRKPRLQAQDSAKTQNIKCGVNVSAVLTAVARYSIVTQIQGPGCVRVAYIT